MIGEELGNTRTAFLLQLFEETRHFNRVITGLGHNARPQRIGFAFSLAGVTQKEAIQTHA
jgi:hypothetical protein